MIHQNIQNFILGSLHRTKVTASGGLALLMTFAKDIGLGKQLDLCFSHLKLRQRGYSVSAKVLSFIQMIIKGGDRLSDIDLLRADPGLLSLLRMEGVPRPNTLADLARRFRRVILDIDSTLVESGVRIAERTYEGFRGFNPFLGMVRGGGMSLVAFSVFRPGNAAPQSHNLRLVRKIRRYLRQHLAQVQVLLRSDSAAYNHRLMRFRPGRNAHQAVRQARVYIGEGNEWVVDLDLEKFFDRVNHDILMERIARRATDKRILRLLRRYLQAGVMLNGVVQERYGETPQGGPLSPLLSNILLDELDKEMERQGRKFCRYADDCNIYVQSERAGHRVMDSVERFLAKRLKLKINRDKSAVARPQERAFLGFSFMGGEYRKIRLAPRTVKNLKRRIKRITGRSRGITMERMIQELNGYLGGWLGYYGIAETPTVFADLDCWIRRRLRCLAAKQWFKSCKTRFRGLHELGVDPKNAASLALSRRGPWAMSNMKAFKMAMPNQFFAERGLLSLSGYGG